MELGNKLNSAKSNDEGMKEPFGLDSNRRRQYQTFHISFSKAKDILTDKRIELLRTLAKKNFESISDLTLEIDRDKKNVSNDIKELYKNGIIDIEQEGRKKAPVFRFSKIEIDPIVFEENQNKVEDKSYTDEIEGLTEELDNLLRTHKYSASTRPIQPEDIPNIDQNKLKQKG